MKKKFVFGSGLLLCAAFMIGSAGCSFSTGTGDNGEKPDDPPVNPDAKVTITYAIRNDEDERALMNAWAKAFMGENKDVQISFKYTMSGMADVTMWESNNDLPDIIWTAGDQHAPYSGAGFFQDLSDETVFAGSSEFFSGFYDALIDSTHYSNSDDGIWFVPRDYNRLVVYLNETAFQAAGIEVPGNDWTWDDFMEICGKFASLPTTIRPSASAGFKQWRPINYTMLRNFGGEYLNEKGEMVIEDEQYAAGVQACYEFYSGLYKTSKDGEGNTIGAYGVNDEGAMFQSYSGLKRSVPMMIDVRPQLPTYYKAAQANEWSLTVRSFPNFVQKDNSAGFVGAGCSGYGISKACTDPVKREWAWKFLKFCMSEEGYEKVCEIGNIVPALKSLYDKGVWREYGEMGEESADAFVDKHTGDIFLNYASSLTPAKQDEFNLNVADPLWKDDAVNGVAFSDAIAKFKQSFKDRNIH